MGCKYLLAVLGVRDRESDMAPPEMHLTTLALTPSGQPIAPVRPPLNDSLPNMNSFLLQLFKITLITCTVPHTSSRYSRVAGNPFFRTLSDFVFLLGDLTCPILGQH